MISACVRACVRETKRGNRSLTDDADDEPRLRSDEQLSDVEYKPRYGKPAACTRARRVHVLGLAEPPAPLQDGVLYPVWPRMGESRVYVKTTRLAAPMVLVSESSDMLATHEHINIELLTRPRKVNDVSSSRVAYSPGPVLLCAGRADFRRVALTLYNLFVYSMNIGEGGQIRSLEI
jgi:hypothetical protein